MPSSTSSTLPRLQLLDHARLLPRGDVQDEHRRLVDALDYFLVGDEPGHDPSGVDRLRAEVPLIDNYPYAGVDGEARLPAEIDRMRARRAPGKPPSSTG